MVPKRISEKTERKKLAILRVLRGATAALSSAAIAARLRTEGNDVSERTVRLYLQELCEKGLVARVGRGQNRITPQGEQELDEAHVIEKVGFLAARIDELAYRMSFSLEKRTGNVVANLTILRPEELRRGLTSTMQVFERGFAMGTLMGLLEAGERVGDIVVPQEHCGVATVCSVTLNGVLLHHGIPTTSRFGGLLEVVESRPRRFVEIITYDGTSIDPLMVFVQSRMTDYVGAVRSGSGRIGVGFREFPAGSKDHVLVLAEQLQRVGLGGFMEIGFPGQALLGVPVGEGRFGAIVIGGLNPAAILEELGVHVRNRALAGLFPYEGLFPYYELEDRARARGLL